ncbi:hypothetical protein C5167_039661 [Papaver somniferum]|uniref:Uncharacterized protein n=1 Tax=Papaver somniferum TaxID=3469 RepID=A0A4Y7IH00_PAPSO|nr:hypothetical protein C5167_039661 [Papaver somniferum]
MNECRIVAGGVQLMHSEIELMVIMEWNGGNEDWARIWDEFENWELHNKLVQLDITREGQEDAVAVADGVMMGLKF